MHYAVPPRFSCRNVWMAGVYVVWFVSAILTAMAYVFFGKRVSGHVLWICVLIKDFVVGSGSLFLILGSAVGLFNSCYCWSLSLTKGEEDAVVPLDTDAYYTDNTRKIYSYAVWGCIGLETGLYAFIIYRWWDGVKLVRWRESRRRKEWVHEAGKDGDHIMRRDSNFLLFGMKSKILWMRKKEGVSNIGIVWLASGESRNGDSGKRQFQRFDIRRKAIKWQSHLCYRGTAMAMSISRKTWSSQLHGHFRPRQL